MQQHMIANRFRGFLPVVVDVETGGVNVQTDALLEVAAVIIDMDECGNLLPGQTVSYHIEPAPGLRLDPASMAINGIRPDHPFRLAVPETDALNGLFKPVRKALKATSCNRAVLVGHNAAFDLAFLNAAVQRNQIKRNPFHLFSCFDTATLAGLAYGQTVLARALSEAGIRWDERNAHSAIYDAESTAELFCAIVNRWRDMGGWQPKTRED